MTPLVELVTRFVSLGVVAADIGIIVLVAALVLRWRAVLNFVSRYALWIGFFTAFGSLVGSLFYSNYAGFTPCTLCWIQRIFIYPLVPIFAIALWKRDSGVVDYAFSLSAIGVLVAIYHTYIQFGGSSLLPCSAEVSCAQRFFVEYGYVTIPTMSLTAFALIALCMLALKKHGAFDK